ncbi:MAG: hypothetical protein VB855_17455 [Pirellulaceae bacterium]
MSNIRASKLNQLRQKAGDRYTPLVFYQTVLNVLAVITLVLGILSMVVCTVAAINTEEVWLLFSGLFSLISCIWTYFILKVIANLILAVTDMAVNSHLQVYLLSEKE